MKISHMLKREDFYKINQQTLDQYYHDPDARCKLYIYPELNAIVTAHPSAEVKRYLYTEFQVKTGLLKRLLIFIYTRLYINSMGLLAAATCRINGAFRDDCLIYPCNKKIRIFDFGRGIVRVIPKKGFSDVDLRREIIFRTSRSNAEATFIPKILESNGNEYYESIIDGYPLARTRLSYCDYKDKAWKIWQGYIASTVENVSASDYAKSLHNKYLQLEDIASKQMKKINFAALARVEKYFFHILQQSQSSIAIGLSHGDLQPGNIWIEKRTHNIYIIDWEAYDIRSLWYDECTLNNQIRMEAKLREFVQHNDLLHHTVLYEDLIFRLTELNNMPYDYYGKQFDAYVATISVGKQIV